MQSMITTRWAAIGAAVAVTVGAGGIGLVSATSPSDAVAYVPIEPCRAADTRPELDVNIGPRNTPLGADETHTVNAGDGDCAGAVAAGATGLQLNVTALGATSPTFLTVWAGGERPDASSLNPSPGQPPVPNAVTTAITAGGDFDVYNLAGNVHVIVDVVGFYIDHHHDDRYYTEAEIDQQLADRDFWAVVNADGTRARSTTNLVTSAKVDLGRYEVIFDRDVSSCAHVVSLGHPTDGSPEEGIVGTASLFENPNGVFVRVRDLAGDLIDAPFHLIVMC